MTTLYYKVFTTLLVLNVAAYSFAVGKEGWQLPFSLMLPLFGIMLVIYIWFPLKSFFKKV